MSENIGAAKFKNAYEALSKMKTAGIIASIIMILFGICMFSRPIATSGFFLWFLIIGMFISGIEKIITYFKTEKEARSGLTLALGIIWVICGLILIVNICDVPLQTTLELEAIIAIIIGFNCIFSGIEAICLSGKAKEMGRSSGMMIFCGIIEIICGICILSAPLMGLMAITVCFGIYMLIMGIALLVRCLSIKKA